MKIALGGDHGGFQLKEQLKAYLEKQAIEVVDFGAFNENSVDYPDIAEKVGRAVAAGDPERGILICGTGIGISIATNKIKGIRAALCADVYSALMSREHNDANILCLGGRTIGSGHAEMIVDTWLHGVFRGGRHAVRTQKIAVLEQDR